MKRALVLVALVAALGLVYWKFRDQIHDAVKQKTEEVKQEGATAIVSLPTPAAPAAKPDEGLPLIDAEYLNGLPASFPTEPTSDPRKTDLVVEVVRSGLAKDAELPPQILLSSDVWLDTSALRGEAGGPQDQSFLVHLKSVPPLGGGDARSVAQATAEPTAAALQTRLRDQQWRKPLAVPSAPARLPFAEYVWWITDFLPKYEAGELKGDVMVEGTFASYHRAQGNQRLDYVTLHEARNHRFNFIPPSAQAAEAEKLTKQGHRVTMRLKLNLDGTPKFFARECHWLIPLKDQTDFWSHQVGERGGFYGSLALGAWAESRKLAEMEQFYSRAHGEVARENVGTLGMPAGIVRIHLADEVHDRWYYPSPRPLVVSGHLPPWHQQTNGHIFSAVPPSVCVFFRVNTAGAFAGDYYRM